MDRLSIKRGDTLALDCEVDVDLAGWDVRAQIRDLSGRLLAELELSMEAYDATAKVTRYVMTVPAATTSVWPLGSAELDIQYIDPAGVVQSTESVSLLVGRDITR